MLIADKHAGEPDAHHDDEHDQLDEAQPALRGRWQRG